jgi:hypothetical protein
MKRRHKKRVVIYAAALPPAAPSKPPEPPAAPAPSGPKPESTLLAVLVELAVIIACVVGFVTILVWLDALAHPPPPPGWVCWSVTRETATQHRRSDRCEPADGWHVEEWPGVGRVAVPDRVRRYQVRG